MRNIKITLSYNGYSFHGWQKQQNLRTVEGELEKALFSLTGEQIEVEGSGRTDAGVHALGQVANFFMQNPMPIKNLPRALNNLLPEDIRIEKAEVVSDDFHARFSAKKKTYEYVVQVGGKQSAISCHHVAYFPFEVDFERMQNACKLFVGKHDFRGFCSADTSAKTFEREIFDLCVKKRGRRFVFSVTGSGFLYNMVRIIVGTLLDVGRGVLDEKDIEKALSSGERKHAGQTMPACGLYLKKVEYV